MKFVCVTRYFSLSSLSFDFALELLSLVVMPHHCCVPSCYSNSRTTKGDVSFHSFPSDGGLRRQWLANIKRDVGKWFSLNEHTKICSLHFPSDCFHEGEHRRLEGKLSSQTRRKLKKDAVPTIFSFRSLPKKRKEPAKRHPGPPPKRTRRRQKPEEQGEGSSRHAVAEGNVSEIQGNVHQVHGEPADPEAKCGT